MKHDAERRQRSSDWQTEAGSEVQPVKRYTNDPEKREKQKFAARLKFANNLLPTLNKSFTPARKLEKLLEVNVLTLSHCDAVVEIEIY